MCFFSSRKALVRLVKMLRVFRAIPRMMRICCPTIPILYLNNFLEFLNTFSDNF